MADQLFEENRRYSRLDPIGTDVELAEGVEDRVRIVYVLHLRCEAVTVIISFQLHPDLLRVPVVGIGQIRDSLGEIFGQLAARDSADGAELSVEREVVNIVKTGEDADFPEFGDSGEKHELQIVGRGLEVGVERRQFLAEKVI